jgi:hypothetical protein
MKRIMVRFLLVLAVSAAAAAQPVTFHDVALKAAVEAQLHVSNPTAADMLRLEYLVAQENGITRLAGLEYAVNLNILNLSNNPLADLSPLSGLTHLTRLYLNESGIADVRSLRELKKLQFLSLSYNEITDVSALSGLSELTELDLASNKIRNLAPLAGLVKLMILDLSDNEITDLSALAGLTKLTNLSLSYNQIIDLCALAGLTKLTELDLGLNEITDITPLSDLKDLKELRLDNNRISDIAPLAHMANLSLLSLEWDNPLNPAAYCVYLPLVRRNNPDLTLFCSPQTSMAPGDCTGDCRVDLHDFALFAPSWRQPLGDNAPVDFAKDRFEDFRDLAVLAANWLGPVALREFRFDASPCWNAAGQWQFGVPQGKGGATVGRPDPNAGCTGPNVYGLNLAGDYDAAKTGSHYLTTGPVDCSAFHNITLTFSRWLNTDAAPYVRCTVEISTDGKTWKPVWQNPDNTPLTDAAWTRVAYDIRADADGRPEVYLRWGCEILEGARPCSGWNIDDVVLWGNPG